MDAKRNEETMFSAKCKHCEKSFFNAQILSLHEKAVHQAQTKNSNNKNFVCDKCDRNYFSRQALERHVLAVHDKIKNFECDTCNKTFAFKYHLKRHISGSNT